jgi:putative endonuclease|tara:strand:- start:807 stop:1109 length:303 start_codon:yes stop_codon:yes gene_type:complete
MANYNVSGLMTLAELAKSKQQSWFVYILLCSDNTLYTGITNNIDKRLEDHQRGVGAKYTKGRSPISLLFKERHPNRSSASKRESEIKSLTKKQKLTLLQN